MPSSTSFSIIVTVGSANKEITLFASDFASVVTNGWHFALPANSTVTVGSLTDFLAWINGRLNALGITTPPLPTTASNDWPTALKDIFNGVLGAQVTINRFVIDQKPKAANATAFQAMEYSLDVSARAASPLEIIPGAFSVVGAGISITKTN